jgi:hypothetical protein
MKNKLKIKDKYYCIDCQKEICLTCEHWKRYLKLEDNCLCSIHSRSMTNIYTSARDSCELWKKFKHNFKKFRDSIKLKLTMG